MFSTHNTNKSFNGSDHEENADDYDEKMMNMKSIMMHMKTCHNMKNMIMHRHSKQVLTSNLTSSMQSYAHKDDIKCS